MKYDRPKSGEWVRPVRRGYKMACCDCGLVHRMDFMLTPWGVGSKIWFRVFRDERATSAMRRKHHA
jgi:hypothetical protein